MRVAAQIALSGEARRRLDKWASSRSTPVRLRERSRIIVLMVAEGMTNKEIATKLGIDANKVGRWRTRYAAEGAAAIEKERPRQPRRQGHACAGGVARAGARGDDADDARRRHALVVPDDGAALGHDAQLRQPGVAVPRPQAAPDPDLQAEQRPALRGEAAGRGGAVPWTRRRTPRCSASTRRARSRRWTGRSRACR